MIVKHIPRRETRCLASESPTVSAVAQRTIVVAEDETTTRILLQRILERHGLRVITVENGYLACKAVRREKPDLVLLDWSMPAMDDRAALETLKADAATRSVPAMMQAVTARSTARSSR